MNISTFKPLRFALFIAIVMGTNSYANTTLSYSDKCESETAFAFLNDDDNPMMADEASDCFIPQFNRWGWTTYLDFSEDTGQSSYTLDIYAGAGQCDLTKGTDVGSVSITFSDNALTFNYDLEGYVLSEAHIYVGSNPFPTNNGGQETVAPGKYTFTASDFGEVASYTATIPVDGTAFYIIVHGVTKSAECVDPPNDECIDSDGDTVCDSDDICPGSDDTIDTDGDGIPDGCDKVNCVDTDGDTVCDTDDVCPGFDDTIDTDGDGIPDGCDKVNCEDSDGDTVCDIDDICPGFDDTIDNNGNGIPDGCDSVYAPADVKVFSNQQDQKINIQYQFEYDTPVQIEVFDAKGIQLAAWLDTNYSKDKKRLYTLDTIKYSSQLLFIRISTNQTQITKKIISSY